MNDTSIMMGAILVLTAVTRLMMWNDLTAIGKIAFMMIPFAVVIAMIYIETPWYAHYDTEFGWFMAIYSIVVIFLIPISFKKEEK